MFNVGDTVKVVNLLGSDWLNPIIGQAGKIISIENYEDPIVVKFNIKSLKVLEKVGLSDGICNFNEKELEIVFKKGRQLLFSFMYE